MATLNYSAAYDYEEIALKHEDRNAYCTVCMTSKMDSNIATG